MSEQTVIEEIKKKLQNIVDSKAEIEQSRPNVDWKNYEEVKQHLENLKTEYTLQCFGEKRADGCHRLANLRENVGEHFKESAELYKRNCDLYKYPRSCYSYANAKILGRGCDKDEFEAYKYHRIGCELKEAQSCYMCGTMQLRGTFGAEKDVNEAVKNLEFACEKDVSSACSFLFEVYIDEKNYNYPENKPRALECAIRACELGTLAGCVNASVMYKKGDGIPKNKQLSNFYRQRAQEMFKPPPQIVFGESHTKI